MEDKYKLLIVFIFSLNLLFLKGQKTVIVRDTVTVYDTIFIYDTVKIHEKIIPLAEPQSLNILVLDTLHKEADLLLISKNNTATIRINSIISNENLKNSEAMKKLSFFGVVLFAFQNMVMGQTEFGISAGGGTWWATCNKSVADIHYTPAFNAGLFLKQQLGTNFCFQTGLNYFYLKSNYSYKTQVLFDSIHYNYDSQASPIIFGEAESASSYYQLSVPLQIGYKLGRIEPFLGIEYSYRISESWLNNSKSLFGLNGGFNCKISEKLSLQFSYHYGITKEYEHRGLVALKFIPESANEFRSYDYFWRSSRIGLSLYYTFLKKEKE